MVSLDFCPFFLHPFLCPCRFQHSASATDMLLQKPNRRRRRSKSARKEIASEQGQSFFDSLLSSTALLASPRFHHSPQSVGRARAGSTADDNTGRTPLEEIAPEHDQSLIGGLLSSATLFDSPRLYQSSQSVARARTVSSPGFYQSPQSVGRARVSSTAGDNTESTAETPKWGSPL